MKLSDQIRRKIAKVTPHRMMLVEIGNIVQRSIQGFGRLGKNPDKKKQTPELAKSTVKMHKYLERAGNAGEFYGDKKVHNISGQLFDSIKYRIDETKQTVTIRPDGNRQPYKKLDGSPIKGSNKLDNYELAKELNKKRPFMYLSFEVKRRIITLISNTLRRYLKK